jgi:outer membrane protein assembly factor BamD
VIWLERPPISGWRGISAIIPNLSLKARVFPMRLSPSIKFFLLALIVLSSGCSLFNKRGKDDAEVLPVEQMYSTAKQALAEENYAKSIKYDQRLVARFPFGPYTEQATLDLAYAQYKVDKQDDAYSTVNRFIKTYPTHKHVDYAYYLRGIINFDRDKGFLDRYANQDMTKRDQGNTLQSFEDLSELVTRFPNSRYAADARQRMIYLRDNLSRAQIAIAEFYLQRGAYVAAVNRSKEIIEKYQRTPAAGDALAVMVLSYKALNQPKLAEDTERVLKLNYPGHPYFSGQFPQHEHWWGRMVPFRS